MSHCAKCKLPTIKSLWCGEEVILAPGPRVFATLEPFAEDPADGVRVFCATNSYVEHGAVCLAVRETPVQLDATPRPTAKKGARR